MANVRSGLTISLMGESPLVTCGVQSLVSGIDGISVVPLEACGVEGLDVALLDPPPDVDRARAAVQTAVAHPSVRRVVVYTWDMDERRVRTVLQAGAWGVLSKTLGPVALAEALHRIHAGEVVVSAGATPPAAAHQSLPHGVCFTKRETEVLGLICDGLSNDDVCERLGVSLNSTKMYIRNAYRKMGVQTRAQAVVWAYDHGLCDKWA